MSDVAVVTDSTAYLPPGMADRHGVAEVPLHVCWAPHRRRGPGGLAGRRRVGAVRAAHAGVDVAADAGGVRRRLPLARHACVVSIHLSAELSGTYDAAVLAAGEVAGEGVDVRVVDSRMLAMGLGFAVVAAPRPRRGGDVAQVVAAAVECAARTDVVFYVDTLEHLRRGGRIGAAAALVGAALAVKPLLHVADGGIAPLEKVRTASKALARLEDIAVERAGDGPVDLAVHHLAAQDKASALLDRLRGASRRWCRRTSRRSARSSAPTSGRPARGRGLPAVNALLPAAVVVGYLVGALSPATLAARRGGVDLRGIGSGNPARPTSAGRWAGAPASSSPSSTSSRACCPPPASEPSTTARGCSPASRPCSGT
jgi:fatty acid-binding protein DegV